MRFKNQKEEKKLLNCICEVNIDGKMALVSLYDDLPHFEYDLTIDNLKNSVTKLKTLVQELKQRINKLENEKTKLQTVNNVLSKNITSLYKTANIEIQRKDKIIDDLRKSQIVRSTSKMFFSTNNFQIDKTKVSKLSESEKNEKNKDQINSTTKNTEVLNPNNNDNITSVLIKPNRDIPKTIYYKRMCKKLAQQNNTIESKKQSLQQIENTNTDEKITQDKIEELNNEENTLKEMSTSLIHNESKDIINSTLVICESDITPSDCELDTTPVIQCDNQENDKENVSTESFFSTLKQPVKLKKKLIITPATIGVQNTHTKTFKCDKKVNQIDSLASITQCEITNSPKKQIVKSSNKDTILQPDYDLKTVKTEDKPLTTDILHNQQLIASEKNNQIQSINIEAEQFPFRRKNKIREKDIIRKYSQITVTCKSPSIDNEFNKSIENVKSLSMNNIELSTPSQENNNQQKCNLDILKCANSITESKHLNNSFKSSSKNISVETSPSNKIVIPSINDIEVKQIPIARKTNAIKRDRNTLNKSNKVAQSSCIKDHKNKDDSKTDNKQLSTDTLHNQKLSTDDDKKQISSINIEVEQVHIIRKTKVLENNDNILNRFKESTQKSCIKNHKYKHGSKTDDKQLSIDILRNQKLSTCQKINQNRTPSINIEVEQFPIRRRKTVIEKDNNSIVPSNVRNSSCVTFMTSSIDDEFNKSTDIKFLSMNNDKEPLSPSQQNVNQSKCNLNTLKCANDITESKHLNNSFKSSSKNISVETSPSNKTVIPSINIEVEQGFIFKQSNARKVIMRSTSYDKQEIKKGRRVQLITIKDHYSEPVPSFNGAKKTDIDVSKKSILIEKVVESSSHFYVPQVKRRRTMNFGSSD